MLDAWAISGAIVVLAVIAVAFMGVLYASYLLLGRGHWYVGEDGEPVYETFSQWLGLGGED